MNKFTQSDLKLSLSSVFEKKREEDRLLIIQCDSGHLYGDLIACARYRIDDEREKVRHNAQGNTHVLFIVHLPRQGGSIDKKGSSFVGFQGGSWISAHIDDIRSSSGAALTLDDALSAPISDLFYNMGFVSCSVLKHKTTIEKGWWNTHHQSYSVCVLLSFHSQLHVLYNFSDDSCVQDNGIQPMELGDQEEPLVDDITENEVVMSGDVELALGTPSVYHEVQHL